MAAIIGMLFISRRIIERYIIYYCIINAFCNGLAISLAINKINNMPIVYFLMWTEVVLLFIYFRQISTTLKRVNFLGSILIVYSLFALILLALEDFFKFDPYSLIFEGFLIFMWCILYFIEQLKEPKTALFYTLPQFWIVSGLLVYYGSIWLLMLGAHYFSVDTNLFIYIWDGQNILSILKNIFISIGFIYSNRSWRS